MIDNADRLAMHHAAAGRRGSGAWARDGDLGIDDDAGSASSPPKAAPATGTVAATGNGVSAEAAVMIEPANVLPRDVPDRSADAEENTSGQENGRHGVRANRNGKPRAERPELTQAERIARRRERQERNAAAGEARPDGLKAAATAITGTADVVAPETTTSTSTALATVNHAPGPPATVAHAPAAPASIAPDLSDEAAGEVAGAEAAPAGPVTFEEVQASYQEAAAAFREVRKSLNSAYTLIGRLNVERYQAQYELAELKGLPLPERPPERSWKSAAKPVAPPEAKRVKRPRRDEEEELVDEEEVRKIGKRRQRLTVIGLAALGVLIIVYRLSGSTWFPNLTDRQAMTQIAGLGVMMQAFFLVFFLFRLGTITGKGKSWLFPTPEQEAFKRRRKRMRGH